MVKVEARAKRLFTQAFPWLGWPEGWRVVWADALPDAFGICRWNERLIEICRTGATHQGLDHLDDTLVHEMVHMVHGPSLPHGRAFSQRVRWAKRRAGVL